MMLAALISPHALQEKILRDNVLVVDCRTDIADATRGALEYAQGHIPGAIHADLDRDLSDLGKTSLGRHPLPDAAAFSATLGRWGWKPGLAVVAYDAANGALAAARLWWMLHVLGEPVAVLDGGLPAWRGRLEHDIPMYLSVEREPRPWPAGAFVDADELGVALADGSAPPVLDGRTAERYAQGDPAVDPKPGHIPGARSAPWADNLDAAGRFLPGAELRRRYAALGVTDAAVAYCGSGVTSCHDLLALTLAGVPDLRLYTGSWSQWANDPSREVEEGRDPGPPR